MAPLFLNFTRLLGRISKETYENDSPRGNSEGKIMKGLKFPPVGKVTQSVISLNLEMQMRTKKLSWVMLDYTHIYICRVILKKFFLQEK